MKRLVGLLIAAGLVVAPMSAFADCPTPTTTQGVDENDGVYTVSAKVEVSALLWVANAGEDTVSKIDTAQNRESARYSSAFWSGGIGGNGTPLPSHSAWAGPAPSRSAVDFNGHAYIANRGFNRVAEVMKVLSVGCIDRNNNGTCDTSQDFNGDGKITSDEMYPIIDDNGNGIIDDNEIRDERVVWIRRVGGYNEVARALAIDKDGALWIGMYNTYRFYKMDATTGATLGHWSVGVRPYGAVVDSKNRLFTAILGSGWSRRFDTTNPSGTLANFYVTHGYGISLGRDPAGTDWVVTANHSNRGFMRFNPDTLSGSYALGYGYSAYGVSFDTAGDVVISGAYGWGTRGATKVRVDGSVVWTRTPPAGCQNGGQRGAIIDANNDIWVVSVSDNRVCKYLSDGSYSVQVPVGRLPYTYSDASGIGLQYTDPTGKLVFISEAPQFGHDWEGAELCFDGGGAVTVAIAAADTEAGLEFANAVAMPLTVNGTQLCGTVPAGVKGFFLSIEFSIKDGGTVVVQPNDNGDCSIELPTANEPPVAACIADVTLNADAQCAAAVPSVNDGSSDPDGAADIASITQSPAANASIGLGQTTVDLKITDLAGEFDTCQTKVTVVDAAAPTAACNIPADGFTPPSWGDGAVSLTATGGDNCSVSNVAISGYSASKNGKDKTANTDTTINGATISIGDSAGVGTTHTWTVTVTDGAGNKTSTTCEFTVANPGNGGTGGGGNDKGGCNNGGGNGAEGCSPSAQGNDDGEPAGTETIKNEQTVEPGNSKGKGKKK